MGGTASPPVSSHPAETGRELQEYMPVFQAILDIRSFTPEELFEGLISP